MTLIIPITRNNIADSMIHIQLYDVNDTFYSYLSMKFL